MCRVMQRSPVAINKVIGKLGIEPAIIVNGVSHYAADDAERIFDAIYPPTNKGPETFRDSIVTKSVSSPSPRPGRGGSRRAPGGETGTGN
jgi:hypothetical protein